MAPSGLRIASAATFVRCRYSPSPASMLRMRGGGSLNALRKRPAVGAPLTAMLNRPNDDPPDYRRCPDDGLDRPPLPGAAPALVGPGPALHRDGDGGRGAARRPGKAAGLRCGGTSRRPAIG